jgi:hypothetical protein
MLADDNAAITNIINLYPIAVDCRRFELFDHIFTTDVRADFGGPAQWSDRASLTRDFAIIHNPFDHTQHFTSNHVVVVNGELATCTSYFRARLVRKVSESVNFYEASGWYDDRLVRTKAGWRINARTARTIWADGDPRVLQTMPGVTVEQQFTTLHEGAAAGTIGCLAFSAEHTAPD